MSLNPVKLLLQAAALSLTLLQTSPAISQAQAPTSAPAYLQRTGLVFELDEGFGNGVIHNQDKVGLKRIVANMKAFQAKFEVYALLPASAGDRSKLTNILDALQAEKVPFVLEAESSDTLQLNHNAANAPYDASHGFGSSVVQLQALKQRYGDLFAGVRFMEVFGSNQQIVGCKLFAGGWCARFANFMPSDNFFEKSLVEPYVAFAHRNGMFVLFGDHYWAANYDPRKETYDGLPYFNKNARVTPTIFDTVIKQPQNERDLQDLAAKYPDTMVPLYDNNDGAGGVDSSAAKIDTWESRIIRPLVSTGGFKGFGLSDQAWLCPEAPYHNDGSVCPVRGVIAWANKALAKGALVIETEPYWYWFNMPAGAEAVYDYTSDPQWAHRGYATANLQAFASDFGVALPSQPIAPTPKHPLDRFVVTPSVSCLSGPTASHVFQVSWPYALPAKSRFSVADDPQGANGRYVRNATGLLGANGPEGLKPDGRSPGAPEALTIEPGKTYYVTIYDGALDYRPEPKAFTLPLCAKPQSDARQLDSFTVEPTVSCLSQPTGSNVVSVRTPYVMPAKSMFNISDSASYANGYYGKSIAGLASDAGPLGFQPSKTAPQMPNALTITPGETYYVTLYDAQLNHGSVKSFVIPKCAP